MSSDALFDAVGFRWDRSAVPPAVPMSQQEALFLFRRSLPAHVWDLTSLEGNPFTYPEVQTLIDGVSVGGRKLADQQQVLRVVDGNRMVADVVERGAFGYAKELSDAFNAAIASGEALEAGHFRGEGAATSNVRVNLGALGEHVPLPTSIGATDLIERFNAGTQALTEYAEPAEAALAYFCFAADQQFYFDGNKRTARCMTNAALIGAGYQAVLIPAARQADYHQSMVRFHATRDATEIVCLLAEVGPAYHSAEPPPGIAIPAPAVAVDKPRLGR